MFKHYFSDTIFCGVNYKMTKKVSFYIRFGNRSHFSIATAATIETSKISLNGNQKQTISYQFNSNGC